MAQNGRKTIVVDCDLRRPSLHTLFECDNSQGLTTLLLNEIPDPPLQTTTVENLRLLTSGPKPPNPADLLGSKQLDRVIETLIQEADIILFDAPPVVAVTDAVVLGAKVDGVLLVLKAGKTRRDHAERAKQMLESANVRLIGATLINAPQDGRGFGDYYG